MKIRGLLIAVVLLAALGGLAWWSERRQKAEEGKPPKDAPPKLVSIADDQIQRVDIKRRSGDSLTLARNSSNQWEIVAPAPMPADPDTANTMISSLSQLSADRVVEEKAADLTTYGLNPPVAELTITKKDGKSEKLLMGDETPLGNGAYAKLATDPRVVTIASYSKQNLDKSVSDLRDKHLVRFDADKLTGVEMTVEGKSFAFARNANREWAIVKPTPMRADNFQVEELVRKLKDLQMLPQQADDASNAAGFASGKPLWSAQLTDSSGIQTIEVRDKAGTAYAKTSGRPSSATLETAAATGLPKPLDDFRNKKLFDFGFNDPTKVEIREGAKSYWFVKGGEKWFLNGKEMDATGVQATISRARDLTATGFTETGFGNADVEVAVIWENGKRTDRVQFTKTPKGYIGRRQGEPGLYVLDAPAVDEIVKSAADVKEAQPPKDAAKDQKKK